MPCVCRHSEAGRHPQDCKAGSQMHSSQCSAAWHSQTPSRGSPAPLSSHVGKRCPACCLSCFGGTIYRVYISTVLGCSQPCSRVFRANSECHSARWKQECFHPAGSRANGTLSRQPLGGLVRESQSPGQQSCGLSAE